MATTKEALDGGCVSALAAWSAGVVDVDGGTMRGYELEAGGEAD